MRNNKPTKDTLCLARQAIAKRILASPLALFIGNQEVPVDDRLQYLRRMASGESDWSTTSHEFRRAGSNVTLYINSESVDDWDVDERDRDEAGNEYTQHKLRVEVNWPSHGNSDPGTCLARLEFYREVAFLAADIHAEFCSELYWKLYRTADQRAQLQATADAHSIQMAVMTVIDKYRANMRINATRFVTVGNIIAGIYYHEFNDGKCFELCVTDGGGAYITRLESGAMRKAV